MKQKEIQFGAKSRPLVSVCVPVYNAAKYLPRCLDSLISQTLTNIEIVCVNDGSTDNSSNILDSYAKKYKNIKIINQTNAGLGGARNAGIKNATGEYVGFVDADDYVNENMFKILYNLAKQNKSDIAMCNLDFVPNDIKTKKHMWYHPYEGKITGEFLDRNIQPWNKIVSRELLDKTKFSFFKKNGDDMYIMLMLESKGIVSTDEILYHYRVGHDSMSTSFKIENFSNFLDCTYEQMRALNKTKYKSELKKYFEYRMIYVLIQTMAVAALKRDQAVFLECKRKLKGYDFRNNPYIEKILRKDFSKLEFFNMVYVLPLNYRLSAALTSIKFRGGK